MKQEWAWVRMKMDGDQAVKPFVFQMLIGRSWGDSQSRVVFEHPDREEAVRMADFFNKANEHG